MKPAPKTLGELKKSGWRSVCVKEELRRNLIEKIRKRETLFPGILGYDETVIPQVENALLACHDLLLLGLRGQAKTRIARSLVSLLDPEIPALADTPLRDDPFHPISKAGRLLVERHGDNAPIVWVPREVRYNEKLATPDVTVADLIGDIDPIKAVSKKLDLDDEEVIHYGLIPRSNRGIFAINELPDLQARIQVGLFNILEEQDIQIRSFPVRLPLDLFMIFTANPEDYTNRGNIITPLKDRIAAQILTHYPEKIETGMAITEQEAWTRRDGSDLQVRVPSLLKEIIERVAIEARKSDYVDKNSGVSARLPISLLETIVSAVEKRLIRTGSKEGTARVCDLYESIPAITGKVELVYQGEQEGVLKVAFFLIGRAIKEAFNLRFVRNYRPGRDRKYDFTEFQEVIEWFESGKRLEVAGDVPDSDHEKRLKEVRGLEFLARKHASKVEPNDLPILMEFIIDGLNQNYLLTKEILGPKVLYRDSVSSMMEEVEGA